MDEKDILIARILNNLYDDLCMHQDIHDGWTTHVLLNGHKGLNDYTIKELRNKCNELDIQSY